MKKILRLLISLIVALVPSTASAQWPILYSPPASGGSTSPAGSNTQVQFNSNGSFGASTNLTWSSPTLTLGVVGTTAGQLALASATASQGTQFQADTQNGQVLVTNLTGGSGALRAVNGLKSNVGDFTATGSGIVPGCTGCVIAATSAGGFIGWAASVLLSSPADNHFIMANNGLTAGFGIDTTTDAVLKLQTRAFNAYATIDVLGIDASGTPGASCAVTTPAHLTVVNGIVTVCN